MIKARAAALLLNVALGLVASAGIAFVVSKINEARTKLETSANAAKENADAANQVTSSLKELVSTYEELGDRSEWDTDDLNQAKDIQDQILSLLKDQDGAIQDKLGNLDLENGKYKEQLGILKEITLEQLKAANESLTEQKDAQGKLFQSEAEKQIGSGQYIVSDAQDTEFAKILADKFGATFDENTGVLNLGLDTSTASGALESYEKLGDILSYVVQNYDEAERAELGLYQTILGDRSALQGQADAYNEVSKALDDNTAKIGQYTLAQDLAKQVENKKPVQNLTPEEIDKKVKSTKQYQDAVKEAQETEEEWASGGFDKYGNVNNFHRDKIDWSVENRKKYADFVKENPDEARPGDYSTVLGRWDTLNDADGTEHVFAFTPMLQTDNGLVPLTDDELWNYLDEIKEKAYDENGKLDLDKLMELDATGLDEKINGEIIHVKGMIAGIEGMKKPGGGTFSTADILAQSGDSNEDIINDLNELRGYNKTRGGGVDPELTTGMGSLSNYVGKSMHDAQATAQEGKDKIEEVYQELYEDIENQNGLPTGGLSDKLKDAFNDIAESLGKDSEHLTVSDVLGLTADGVELTDEQAAAIDVLSEAANNYKTTIEGVASASEENGLFGGAEVAANNALAAAKDMETLSQQIDNIQKAYKSCSTAVDEYNQYGYMSADSLQSLLSMDYEYLSCMELVNGKLQLNNEAFAQMVASKYADAKVTAVQNAIAQIQAITQDSVKESTGGATDAMDEQVNKLNELSPGLGDAIKGTVGLAAAQELLNAAEEKSTVDPNRVQTILDGLNTQLSVIDSTINTILGDSSKIKTHLNGFDKNKNNGSSASKSVTDVASAFDTLTKAMKEYNQYGYISADTMKSLVKLEDKFTSCLVKNGNKLEVNANAFRKLVEEQLKKEAETGKDTKSTAELNRILSYLDKNVHSATISFEQLTDVIKGYGSAMDEALEKTNTIKSAFSDLAEVGQNKIDNPFGLLDADSVEKQYQAIRNLADGSELFTNADYADALNPETGEIDYNSDAFKQMFLDSLDDLIQSCKETGGAAGEYLAKGFEDAKEKIAGNVISIEEFINGIGSTLSNINDRMDNFQSAFNDLSDIVDEYNTYGDLSQDSIQKFMALDPKYTACLEKQGNQLVFNKDAFKALYIAELQELATKYEGTEAGKRYADILEQVANGTWDATNHMQGMNSEGDKLKTLFSDLKSLLSDFLGIFEELNDTKSNDLKLWGEAMTEEIDKRIDALNEANDAQERSIELAKLQDEYEKAKASKTVHVYGGRGQGFVWKADDNAVHEAEQNLSDKRREYKLKDETDALNKLKDKYSEVMNLIGTDIDDYNKKLEYAAQIHNMSFEEMSDGVISYKDTVVASLGTVKTVTDIQNTISNVEKLISTLETLANVINLLGGGSGNGGGIFGLINQLKNTFTDGDGNFDLGGGFKKMFEGAGNILSNGWNSLIGKNKAGSTQLANSTNASLKIMGRDIQVNTNAMQKTSSGFFQTIWNGTKDCLGYIGNYFGTTWGNISDKTGLLFDNIGNFFTEGFALLNTSTGEGLGSILSTLGQMFEPIASGAMSLGDAIGSGIISFFPSIFEGLGLLVTSVGSAMGGMLDAIAAALSSIPIAGWIAAAAAVAGAVALVATIASIASNVSSTKVDKPTPSFTANKYAKGTRGVKKDQIANVDEKGEELIVRKPNEGRMTYLEKGDGVIPAKQTDNLMEIGEDPEGWLARGIAKATGSAAVGAKMTDANADGKTVKAAEDLADDVGSAFSDEWNQVLWSTSALITGITGIFEDPGPIKTLRDTAKTVLGVISSIFGGFGDFDLFASNKVNTSKITNSSSITESTYNTKSSVNDQVSSMKDTFESTWKSVAGELNVSEDDITATSKKVFDKIDEIMNNTFDAINDNAGLTAEQVEELTNSMFDDMQKIYTAGWNSLAGISGDMSENVANTLNSAYQSSIKDTKDAVSQIAKAFGGSWNKVGGGVKVLGVKVQKTLEEAWADTSKDTQKLLYDVRACFDNSWGMAEAGVNKLADLTPAKIKDGYAEVESDSKDTFGEEGALKQDADKAWSNVEPGAKNLASNMDWVMEQSYKSIKDGSSSTVTQLQNDLGAASAAFNALAKQQSDADAAKKKAEEDAKKQQQQQQQQQKDVDWSGAAAGAVIGSFLGPLGSLAGAGIGFLLHHASGTKGVKQPHLANVDEQGPEMLVRKPQSGRYTYLETGDGVVPADITSRLFEMGGNPDGWFQDQMSKYGNQKITSKGGDTISTSIGSIVISNPVGDVDALAREIQQKLPTKVAQMQSKR